MARTTSVTLRAGGGRLPGDWRRSKGSKADAHLYRSTVPMVPPVCMRRISRYLTERAPTSARPCYDCLASAAAGRAR